MSKFSKKFGDRATSDVVVRLRTCEGCDNWFYCHSEILTEKSNYFAEHLSNDWPTCQILDSRYCVEVYCKESDFNSHVSILRFLYVNEPFSWYGVRTTLGILRAAVHLGCSKIISNCMEYLESVPWDEADEEEILKTIPPLGPQFEHILARLTPVKPLVITSIFLSAFRYATSSTTASMREFKSSAQDQLDYMLTEDDDSPLLAFDNDFTKSEVQKCVTELLARFNNFISSLLTKSREMVLNNGMQQDFLFHLLDVSWTCQIMSKMEIMKDLVYYWVGASGDIVAAVELVSTGSCHLETRLKVVEVTAKLLEAIGFCNIILPAEKRQNATKIWISFAQRTKSLLDQVDLDDDQVTKIALDSEIWQSLESAIVSVVLTLPSSWQAEIFAEWLRSKHVRYPDLTEAFEVWCYRSKVAKKRLPLFAGKTL